ncbi:MAG: hydrolase [Firmicutes bacterium]|jgi:nicotinamidase-related amidase|uniref:Hydrolase n=1 Tax=Sulfobacillus benefaciens TaxID=453960 RepID=A0A2T2X9H0_9FIRM|nr:hydrolase [Bacillota bacterium]MCL5013138.1 hydrolase [Bacillota bacterium]PSR31135.1 MAG: hydrolase [Sulfobacillus benefaciens]
MANKLELIAQRTALVVIDLQKGIAQMPAEPHTGQSVVSRAGQLADRFRSVGAFVVLVHVGPSEDGGDALHPITDTETTWPTLPPGWDEIVAELGPQKGDHVIRKRQWGAFYGTDLDLQLRRRGIDTIVLCGISTNIGVESTARAAYEHGYQQIFVEDACSARSSDEHHFTFQHIFPRIGRIRSTREVLDALA